MSLRLDATVAARDVEVTVEVADGETLAVLGPNGAGKSTLISLVAGLLRPDRGRATLGDATLFAVGDGRDRWLPPHARGTALLAQEPLLFPHLSVLDNVAFGPRSTGASRSDARRRALAWLEEVGAVDLAERLPAQLSGGQAQRIAVARALAAEPRLLLLDEPLAALDVTTVPAVRQLLRRVLRDRTAIVVTHDVLDALLLADRVLVIEAGRVVEHGPTTDVLSRPRSPFAGQIADLNLCHGRATTDGVALADGTLVHGAAHAEAVAGEAAVAAFSPAAVALYLTPPGGSPRNVLPAVVSELEPRGARVRVRLDAHAGVALSAEVTAGVVAELDLAPGSQLYAVVKATEVSTYPA